VYCAHVVGDGIMVTKRNERRSLCLVSFGFCLLILLGLPFIQPVFIQGADSGTVSVVADELTPNEARLVARASEMLEGHSEYSLKGIKLEYSDVLHTDTWVVSFSTKDNSLVEVKFDKQTEEIIVFFDSSKMKETSTNSEFDYDDAILQVLKFIENHNVNDVILSNCMIPDEIQCDEYNWIFTWYHDLNGIPVKDDRIEIRVNKFTGEIFGFFSKWTEYKPDYEPKIAIEHVEEVLLHLAGPVLVEHVEEVSLEYVYPRTNENLGTEPQLSYVFAFDERCTTQEIWISATSGDFLGDVQTISNGDIEITVCPCGYGTYDDTGSRVQTRFQTNDYSTAYHYEALTDDILDYWYDEDVEYLFHWGHGFKHTNLGTNWYGIVDDDDQWIWPIDILQNCYGGGLSVYPEFVYICSCYSGCYDTTEYDESLVGAFYGAMGVDAYMGWEGAVYIIDAHWFTRIFYNYVFDEYTISIAAAYADLQAGPNVDIVIYGDDDLVLSVTLDVSDSSPGENLGSVSSITELTVWHYDEPVWHPDEDWFCFTVTGEHFITVWVIPEQDNFDVAFILYKSGSSVSRNTQGEGGSEYYSFTHSSGTFQYRVKVVSLNTQGYGGSYDIRIMMTLIS